MRGIEDGFFQREIADSAYRYQQSIERGERIVVGVNKYRIDEEPHGDILKIDEEGEARQRERLADLKAGKTRDNAKAASALGKLTEACETSPRPNLMPFLLECARTYCTLGEIREAMVKVYGEYREPAVF